MSYRFSNTSGVIGKHISLSTTGTSGLFNIQQCYEGMLTGNYPLPPPTYVGYNPRFHDASTNPGDAITKDMQSDQILQGRIYSCLSNVEITSKRHKAHDFFVSKCFQPRVGLCSEYLRRR